MERTKRKSSVYNDYVPYGGRVPNFKEKEGMKLKKEQFDVTGMTCSACSARIEKSVSKLPGIKEVSVNLLKNSMVASYDESILDTSGIIQAVEKAGYGAIPKTLAQSGSKPAVAAGKPEISTAQKDYKQMKQRLLLSAVEYGHKLNLSLETIDDIVTQGKKLGTYMYIYTGGEPMVRKRDLITLCERHPDCEFLSFTNGTLIDEEFCMEMLRVKNFVPAISLEGFEKANDGRRGKGVFEKVMQAMDLLRRYKLPFGISTCYTSANYADISSEAFFDMMIEMGAMFVWFFHYMPVGNDAVPELLPNPDQRRTVYERVRAFRNTKPIFSMDFQNDAEYVGGCIAGGRSYLHINAAGDVEPCVFIHYSNVNIHECGLLDALKSPIFMAYHDGQPFNKNMLRPCPMLENPNILREMVKRTGAKSTDLQSPETVDHLCDKCELYAKHWHPVANELWASSRKGD